MSKSSKKEISVGGGVTSYSVPIMYWEIEDQTRTFAGRILTIIDASITGQQNKALKDLVRSEIHELLFYFQNKASQGDLGHFVQLEPSSEKVK